MDTTAKLQRANRALRQKLADAEDALRAIRGGQVDAIVVEGPHGVQIFSVTGAETVYRLAFETMSEAALNVADDGRILFCNARFSEFVATPLEQIVGRNITDFVPPEKGENLRSLLRECARQPVRQRIVFRAADGTLRPVHLTGRALAQPDGVTFCLVASDLTELETSAKQIDLLREHQHAMEQAHAELLESRRAALASMEEAVAARQNGERTTAALRASEERYRTLFEVMAEGFGLLEIILDEKDVPCDYRFLDINPAFEAQTGLKRSDIVGKPMSEVLPGLEPSWLKIYSDATLTGKTAHFEQYAGPLRRWFEGFAYQTAPRQFAVIFTDVTERKEAERALEAARANAVKEKNRLEAIMEALPVGFALVDAKGGRESSNPTYERIWGEPHTAVRSFNDYSNYRAWSVDTGLPISPEDWASARAVQKGETVVGQLLQIARFDGTRAYVHNNAAPIFDADRNVVGSAVAIMDITNQFVAQEELRETRDYLQNLLDYANAPIIVWDPAFKITRFNHAFERLTGRSARDVLGQSLDILFPKETREEAFALLQRTRTGERWETVEIPILRLDGSVRTVLWNSATLYAHDGKTLTATIAQGQDITERIQAEAERSRYLQNLEFLAESATAFMKKRNASQIFDYIAQKISELTVGAFVLVTEYDEVNRCSIVRALGGDEDMLHRLPAPLTEELLGSRWTLRGDTIAKMTTRAVVEFGGGLQEFSSGEVPETLHRHIEGKLGLRDLTAVPFVWEKDLLGAVLILTGTETLGKNERVIETFAGQAAVVLNRFRTDEALRQREHEYRTLMEDASDGIVLADGEGQLIAVNSKACELSGYTRKELDTFPLTELLVPDEIPKLTGHVTSLAGGGSTIVEHRLRRKDGSQLHVETSARRLADGRYQAILRDISDRKRAEEEFTRAVQSEVFEKLFIALREFHHGEGLAMNLHRIALFAKNSKLLLAMPQEERTQGGQGQLASSTSPLGPARTRLENAVREYVTVGYQHLREIASLLGAVESEINRETTEAGQLLSANEFLSRADFLKADLDELLKALHRSGQEDAPTSPDIGERVAEHVEAIFQGIAGIRRQLNARYTSNISEVARTIVPSFQSASAETTIEIQEDSPDIKAIISPSDLGEVISILLTNSIDSPTRADESGKRITIRLGVVNARARIEVEDNGQGVEKGIGERIFSPGYTTKAAGHGYGLNFAQKHLKKYGGTIACDEGFAGGARFVIELGMA